jgi:hypothetical protein
MIRRTAGCAVGQPLSLYLAAGGMMLGCFLVSTVARGDSVNGSGKAKTEERSIGDANEVAVSGGGIVEITLGEKPSVRVSADDNILPLLEVKNENGKLTFGTKFGYEINPMTPISYVVTIPHLKKLIVSEIGNVKGVNLKGDALTVDLSGAGHVILNDIDYKSLSLNLEGAGHATLSGTAEKATFQLAGTGKIYADDLKAATVNASVSGNGKTTVWATGDLKLKVSGRGRVEYKGKPRIEQSISDKASVRSIDD